MADAFSHSIRLAVSPEEAWPRLQHATTWSGIGGIDAVSEARHHPSGVLESFRFVVVAAGTRIRGTATTVEHVEYEMLELSINSTEITGGVTTQLSARDASGTKLRVMLEMRAKGFLAGMFYPVIAQTVARSLPTQVEKFGARLESAQPPM